MSARNFGTAVFLKSFATAASTVGPPNLAMSSASFCSSRRPFALPAVPGPSAPRFVPRYEFKAWSAWLDACLSPRTRVGVCVAAAAEWAAGTACGTRCIRPTPRSRGGAFVALAVEVDPGCGGHAGVLSLMAWSQGEWLRGSSCSAHFAVFLAVPVAVAVDDDGSACE